MQGGAQGKDAASGDEKPAAKSKEEEANLSELKEQIAAMQRKLDAMS